MKNGKLQTGLVITGVLLAYLVLIILVKGNQRTQITSQPSTATASSALTPEQRQYDMLLEFSQQSPLKGTFSYNSSYFTIKNNDNAVWRYCFVTIGTHPPGGNDPNFYAADIGDIATGSAQNIPWSSLTLPNGLRFNFAAQKPSQVTIQCNLNEKEHHSVYTL